ncbi:MAG: hypothetical protein KAT14_03610 [Candidatus Marinimicrobia bacterium]|nr:hypothetical protein [Candidatus Neomarinimicrobiota bacterium]
MNIELFKKYEVKSLKDVPDNLFDGTYEGYFSEFFNRYSYVKICKENKDPILFKIKKGDKFFFTKIHETPPEWEDLVAGTFPNLSNFSVLFQQFKKNKWVDVVKTPDEVLIEVLNNKIYRYKIINP